MSFTILLWRTRPYSAHFHTQLLAILRRYTSSRHPPPLSASLPLSASSHHSIYDPPKVNHHYASSHAGPSSIGHYDPYAPPRRPSGVSAPIPTSSASKPQGNRTLLRAPIGQSNLALAGIRFKESPFFTVDQVVSNVVECPGQLYFYRISSSDSGMCLQSRRARQIVGSRHCHLT